MVRNEIKNTIAVLSKIKTKHWVKNNQPEAVPIILTAATFLL